MASLFEVRKDADCGLGDDSKDALRADEEAREVHAGGDGAAEGAGADDFARREHDFEADNLLAHGAVLGGEIADAVGGDCAADGGDGLAPRIVADEVVGVLEDFIEVSQG